MKRTALMKLASICRVVRVAILSGVTLFPSIFNEAIAEISPEEDAAVDADVRLVRVEEFRALEAALADLSLKLAAQQELIASQQKDIDRQGRLLQSIDEIVVGVTFIAGDQGHPKAWNREWER